MDKSLKALTVLALMSFKGLESNDYKYPYWSTIIGIILSSSTLYGIIMYAIYYIVRYVIIGKQVRYRFLLLILIKLFRLNEF